MDYKLVENVLTAKNFINLWQSVGWGNLPKEQVETGLKNSLMTISAIHNSQVIGMGRLVGDGSIICYVQDVIVHPEYQGKGIGKAIMEILISFIKNKGFSNTDIAVGLFAAKGKEDFYRKLGFYERPNENKGAGMELILKIT